MSLHTLAHHLQSAGRGNDSVLVHMTPAEVGGLQSLAKASGGSLTINPQTGLPEAGFLSSLLPMIAGAALTATGVGAPIAALMVGGAYGAATGSLKKGLMAGLGAYGGAGLTSGLGAVGATEATIANAPSTVAPIAQNASLGSSALGNAVQNAQALNAAQAAQSTIQPSLSASLQSSAPALNPTSIEAIKAGASRAMQPGGLSQLSTAMTEKAPYAKAALANTAMSAMSPQQSAVPTGKGYIRPYTIEREINKDITPRGNVWDGPVSSEERQYFTDTWKAGTPFKAPGKMDAAGIDQFQRAFGMKTGPAETGTITQMPSNTAGMNPLDPRYNLMLPRERDEMYNYNPYTGMPVTGMAAGGPVERMSAENAVGSNMMYPQSQLHTPMYSNPMMQRPMPENVVTQGVNAPVDPYTGEQKLATGGLSSLGGYSDGGRLLKGPGDGVSDSIPAVIGNRQPARLADGEFVVPARIVSEIGNGSTEAGARKLYAMMERVQRARRKTIGRDRIAKDTNAEKYLPA